MSTLSAVFVDAGGTLFTELHSLPENERQRARKAIRQERLARLNSLAGVPKARASALEQALSEREEAVEDAQAFDPIATIRAVLEELGSKADPLAVREAMMTPDVARPFYDDAEDFLRSARGLGLGMVVVSNGTWHTSESLWGVFTSAGFADALDAVISSVDTYVRKPDPRIFEIALASAGDPLPSTCVMVGDSERKDIAPARALGMLTIRIAEPGTQSAADAVCGTLKEAGDVISAWTEEMPARAAAESAFDGLRLLLAHDSDEERRVRDLLVAQLTEYDSSRYFFTDRVLVDQDSPDAHSHPILTLRTMFSVRTPIGVLSTFLHEQIHWYLASKHDETQATMEDLKALYPDPVRGARQGGARNDDSTYLHLIVNWLEHEALRALVGDEDARATTSAQVIYRWIYKRVLEDHAAIGSVVRRRRLDIEGLRFL